MIARELGPGKREGGTRCGILGTCISTCHLGSSLPKRCKHWVLTFCEVWVLSCTPLQSNRLRTTLQCIAADPLAIIYSFLPSDSLSAPFISRGIAKIMDALVPDGAGSAMQLCCDQAEDNDTAIILVLRGE